VVREYEKTTNLSCNPSVVLFALLLPGIHAIVKTHGHSSKS